MGRGNQTSRQLLLGNGRQSFRKTKIKPVEFFSLEQTKDLLNKLTRSGYEVCLVCYNLKEQCHNDGHKYMTINNLHPELLNQIFYVKTPRAKILIPQGTHISYDQEPDSKNPNPDSYLQEETVLKKFEFDIMTLDSKGKILESDLFTKLVWQQRGYMKSINLEVKERIHLGIPEQLHSYINNQDENCLERIRQVYL